MNKDQIYSLIRTSLKMLGTALVAHGYNIQNSTVELIIGIVLAVVGVVWSHFDNAIPVESETQPVAKTDATKITRDPGLIMVGLLTLVSLSGIVVFSLCGCAYLNLTPQQRATLENKLITGITQLALSFAAAKVTEHNPSMAPLIMGLRDTITFSAVQGAPTPVQLQEQVDAYITAHVPDMANQTVLKGLVQETLNAYTELYAKQPPSQALVDVLGKVTLALDMALPPVDTGATGVAAGRLDLLTADLFATRISYR